ncbi:PAS domain-containing protein [Mesobaculum littorinae]|uniref:PAS domain-containing protein n=1 Tax=Mesobaculum littorinae TaxID=2486419 RepID=A0A438ALU9_9RHOB|nr:PAS domain-containing protein [Mesobaculum littorinae]RVV99652.1 PAS domain-containing protein [Mesobaculum littorinae]
MDSETKEMTNIVSILTRQQVEPGDAFVEVETYWQALCDGRLMPQRSEVDPRGIAGALDHVFLIERISRGEAKLRVAGGHLTEIIGHDCRGLPLSLLFDTASRAELAQAVDAMFSGPARLEFGLTGQAPRWRGKVTGRMLLLPLRDEWGETTRAIGVLRLEGPVTAPQRLTIAGQLRRGLSGGLPAPVASPSAEADPVAAAAPADHPVADRVVDPVPAAERAEVPHPAADTPSRPAGRPHLRLVRTSEDA